ncbi:MAG: hypothetical protein ACOCUS_06040 [Polyangiales bacterium]
MAVGAVAGIVCAIGGGVGWSALLSSGAVPQALRVVGPFAAIGSGAIGGLACAGLAHARRRKPQSRHAVAENEVRCPGCGAPNGFRPGQTLDACKFCGAGLVASDAAMDAGVQAARDAARRARGRWDRFEAAMAASILLRPCTQLPLALADD